MKRFLRILLPILFTIFFSSCAKEAQNEAQNEAQEENDVATKSPHPSIGSMKFAEIRQMVHPNQLESFVHDSTFHALKHPNIYFIFFDTLRPDLALQRGEGFRSFYDRNFSFKQAYAAGTSTVYSTFSLFHSNPGFLTYKFITQDWNQETHYGSLFLKILERLGYKMNSYGYFWECVTTNQLSDWGWDRVKTSFFGMKSRLLERCRTDLGYDAKFGGNQDEVTVAELEKKLPEVITSPHGNFSMLSFYNNHDVYKWGALHEGAIEDIGEKTDYSNHRTLRNRYLNSVAASDINFKRLMKLLQSLPGYQESVIVLFSDHGEMFHEKNKEVSHGGIPFQEKIKIMLSFQFTGDALYHQKANSESFASIADVFPTVFDYMDVSPKLPHYANSGHSLISSPRKSALVVQSNQDNATRDMVMVNQKYKAWVHIDEEDFYRSNSLKLVNLTHLNDQPVPTAEHLCFNKSISECQKVLINEFSDAIADLYPGFHSP